MKLKGAIFDLDGTVVDVPYDWNRIKAELGTRGIPILSYLNSLEEPEKTEKWKILIKYEDEATAKAALKRGMRSFLEFLAREGVKKALVTNNSWKNVNHLLARFNLEFDCVITREKGLWKPSGAPILAAVQELKLNREECCVIGDSHFDVKAAEEAGIEKVFILNTDKEKFVSFNTEVLPNVQTLKKRIKALLDAESG